MAVASAFSCGKLFIKGEIFDLELGLALSWDLRSFESSLVHSEGSGVSAKECDGEGGVHLF